MNKQEVMKKLTDAKRLFRPCWSNDYARDGFEEGINFALETVNKLDEPEKPLLSKEEAEWVDKLKEFFITRCSYGDYSFAFSMCGKTYKLPIKEGINHEELNSIRERLVNAVLYGYEVEKEKFYTAKLKISDEYLRLDCDGAFGHFKVDREYILDGARAYWFTEDDLVKYHIWGNDSYDVEVIG